jgi:hypothetical protein
MKAVNVWWDGIFIISVVEFDGKKHIANCDTHYKHIFFYEMDLIEFF